MEWNKILVLFITFTFICFGFPLSAEEIEMITEETEQAEEIEEINPGYFVDNSGGQPRIYQRLVWEKEEYALNYEIVIQVFNESYRNHIRETTINNYFDVILPPGNYRYNVTPFDLLGRRSDASEWKTFSIIAAYKPEIERFMPVGFNLDQNQRRIIELTGVNLLEESFIYLENNRNRLHPIEVTIISSQRATLLFDDNLLIDGMYDICVQNPGGLEARISGFDIGYRKPLDFFIKLSYNPIVPIYGELKDEMGFNIFLPGASFAFDAISSKRGHQTGGLELAASIFFLNSKTPHKIYFDEIFGGLGNVENGAILTDFNLNMVLQRRFNYRRNAASFRFGFGYSLLEGLGEFDKSEVAYHVNLGMTFLARIYQFIYFEAGVNYSHYVAINAFGTIKPRMGLAFQF